MNGNKYRLAVSTSQQGLSEPGCGFFNDYTLVVAECGPLPVKLSAFNGRYTDGIAYLDWQTSQELNSYGFQLFKSYDGVDFSEVATIRSAGNSNTVKSYTYQDRNINAGNNVYYRIKQIDINGKATFSNIIRLATGTKTGMDVYPNPFNTHFTVSFNTPAASVATLKLRNNTGQVVFSQSIKVTRGNNAVVLNNLPALSNGVYYLTVQNEQFSYNGKLQKQ
jgi:hypothetical protein